MGTRFYPQIAGVAVAMAVLSCGAWAEGDGGVVATHLVGTQEHVILEPGSAKAMELSKEFPGRLRKRPEATTAFHLNNISIEPFTAKALEAAEETAVVPAGHWQPLQADPPTDPSLVAAPMPDRAQDAPGGTLVAAGSPPAATGDSLKCGAKTAKTLTVCLNRERRLDALDRLAVLAFTREPCIAYVDSDSEKAVLVAALGDVPSRMQIAEAQLQANSASGPTAGRIHLVRRP